MKIAITSDGRTMDDMVDQRFGRCRHIIIVDTEEKGKIEVVENQGAIQGHGAGIKAAQQVAGLGVKAVLTGQVGPNANSAFSKLGIKAYHASGKASDALLRFCSGELKEIDETAEPMEGIGDADNKEDGEGKGEIVFFPLLDDKGEDSKISDHFGHAPFFGIYDAKKKELAVIENSLDHSDPTKSPIDQIEETVHPTTIFAKGIGARAIGIIAQKGLKLKTGDYSFVKDAVKHLDELEDQTKSCGHAH